MLARLGLTRALQENIDQFHENGSKIRISTDFSDPSIRVPEQIAIVLYRIYQQALINVIRHAEASEVFIRLHIDNQQALLEIRDNGKGTEVLSDWTIYAQKGHFGIIGMKERAEMVGGSFRMISQPGQGTSVQVIIPLVGQQR